MPGFQRARGQQQRGEGWDLCVCVCVCVYVCVCVSECVCVTSLVQNKILQGSRQRLEFGNNNNCYIQGQYTRLYTRL